jgi:hypothetical protein
MPDTLAAEVGAASWRGTQLNLSYRITRQVKPLPCGSFFSGNIDTPWFAGSIPISLRRQAGFPATIRNGQVPPRTGLKLTNSFSSKCEILAH